MKIISPTSSLLPPFLIQQRPATPPYQKFSWMNLSQSPFIESVNKKQAVLSKCQWLENLTMKSCLILKPTFGNFFHHYWFFPLLVQKIKSSLARIEEDLARARAAIRKAVRSKNYSSDKKEAFIPRGCIYRNPYAFHQLKSRRLYNVVILVTTCLDSNSILEHIMQFNRQCCYWWIYV